MGLYPTLNAHVSWLHGEKNYFLKINKSTSATFSKRFQNVQFGRFVFLSEEDNGTYDLIEEMMSFSAGVMLNVVLGTAAIYAVVTTTIAPTRIRTRRRIVFGGAATWTLLVLAVSHWRRITSWLDAQHPPPPVTKALLIPAKLQEKAKVFILAGQSNMAGRGGIVKKGESLRKVWDVSALTEKEFALTIASDDRVVRLTAEGKWVRAMEPMHQDIDVKKSCGIGPGLIFARSLLNLQPGHIALIPSAVGGTKIVEWAKDAELYRNMIARARSTKRSVEALLWYQGESDCSSLEDADAYLERLREFVKNVREDLHQPRLKIIMVAVWAENLARTLPFAESHIRPAIFRMALEDDYIEVADAKDLSFLDDHIHLTSESQFKLAKMILERYLQLLE